MASANGPSRFLNLPAELVLHTLSYLEFSDLVEVAKTCKALRDHSYDDHIWQPLVNRNLSTPVLDATPLGSFRDLYIAHLAYWFLPRHRIWFADTYPSGKLLISRYNPRGGCIEAYQAVAVRGTHTLEFWEKDKDVIIHSFNPQVALDLNQPVVRLDVDSPKTEDQPNSYPSDRGYAPSSKYSKEILMETFAEAGLYGSFMLCRTLPEQAISAGTKVWPPLRFPAETRTRNETRVGFNSTGHRPTTLSEVSQHNFRLRKWVEYTGRRANPISLSFTSPNGLSAALGINSPYFAAGLSSSGAGGMSIRMPEDITTYATLPKWMYTPTPQKPYQGIWCGDYSGHGCEFIVVHQPDKEDEKPLPDGMSWLRAWFRGGRRGSASSDSSYASAQEELNGNEAGNPIGNLHYDNPLAGLSEKDIAELTNIPYRRTVQEVLDDGDLPTGRLEAIKLTGDPNIPRGEYTFMAPDIGHGGFMRIADEEIFRGARIVRSAGHIFGEGFRHGELGNATALFQTTDDFGR